MILPSHFRLSSKLHILVGTIALALGLMAALMLAALDDVRQLSKETASNQVSKLLENTRFGRQLSEILLDVKLLESGFYANMPLLHDKGDEIQQRLNKLVLNAPDELHRDSLVEYTDNFRTYLRICSSINLALEQQALLSLSLNTQLDLLESKLSKWLVEATIQGEDVYFYEQLLSLVTGYRETLLRIGQQQAFHEGYTLKRAQTDWYQKIQRLIDDFLSRLETASASTPEISLITSSMQDNLELFRLSHTVLEKNVQDFWRYAVVNEKSANHAFLVLSEAEKITESTANRLAGLLENIITNARDNILLILVLVLLIAVVSATILIRTQIREPLEGLISGIEQFRNGNLGQLIDLQRKDEWFQVQTALNQMAQALQRSYEQLKEKQENLNHLAHHDSLTGLPNRLLLLERLEHSLLKTDRTDDSCAMLFMDIDRFKNVNDSLGHAAGDQLLCEIAQRINKTVRKVDTVSRLGGDEFTIILDSLSDPHDAALVAQAIRNKLAKPIHISGRDIYITSSIGISVYPQDGTDAETLIKNADAAMYKAKQNGRNGYQFYTQQMTEEAFSRMELESSLHKAIQNDEFIVFYQPQVDLRSGEVIGAEALIRWHHPEKGLLPPDSFIPIAEDTGLILEIDFWVLRNVCKQLQSWYQSCPESKSLTISVNLSGRHMEQSNLPDIVREIVDGEGIDSGKIELEITESFIMHHLERSSEMLKQIKKDGFRIAIDDFGTGYSSLNYLKKLPVDTLKIDRTFVADLKEDKHDEAIVKSVISLGENLGLSVVAEGIENQSQLAFLRAEKCTIGQGYYFERPIIAEDFIQLVREKRNVFN
ncbi:MAG: putative bifunctional diguanylate cyclase/phosphodiesterase [Neptuniibacter sp.]